jgi:peptidoglycan/LPS O-acetylase OafA/YrhL
MFWLATAVKIALVSGAQSRALRFRLYWGCITHSLLKVPVRDKNREVIPFLPVGWTLSFEMTFYSLFAFMLALKVHEPDPQALVALGLRNS